MKKKIVVLMLSCLVLAGCSNNDTTTNTTDNQTTNTSTSTTAVEDEVVPKTPVEFESTIGEVSENSIIIPEYSSINVEVPNYTLSNDDINNQINNEYAQLVYQLDKFIYTDKDKDTVEKGDVVLIDFVGKVNGEVFDKGSANDMHLEIGSGAFIDGFESGLEGVKVGETKDITCTFPEDYQNTDLAGKDAVFTVTVKKIQNREMPEMTDDIIKSFEVGPQTVEEFTKGITDNLTNNLVNQNNQAKQDAIENALINACDFEVPQEKIDTVVDKMIKAFETEADEHGETLEQYFDEHMDVTIDQYRSDCADAAKDIVKKLMIFEQIAKNEGIFVSEEAVQQRAELDYQSMGYSSVEEYMDNVDKEALYDYILENAVINKIEDKLNITKGESIPLPTN